MRRIAVVLALFLVASVVRAGNVTWIIPAFAEQVSGAYGSVWQSELRLTNPLDTPVIAQFGTNRALTPCSIVPVVAPSVRLPKGTTILRSVVCGPNTIATAEVSVDSAVRIDSVLYETKGSVDSTALTGVSTTVPVAHKSEENPGGAFISNVVVDRQKQRVNLFLFGPMDAVATRIDILDDHLNLLQTKIVNVGANGTMTLVADLLSGVPDACCATPKPLPDAGAFNITIGKVTPGDPSQPNPTGILSVVDNTTNDSTIFAPSQVLFTKNAATLP